MRSNEILTIVSQKLAAYDSRYIIGPKQALKLSPIVGISAIASTASNNYRLRYTFNVQIADKDATRLYTKTDDVIELLNKYPIGDGNLNFLASTFVAMSETFVAEMVFSLEVTTLPKAVDDLLTGTPLNTIDVLINENCEL